MRDSSGVDPFGPLRVVVFAGGPLDCDRNNGTIASDTRQTESEDPINGSHKRCRNHKTTLTIVGEKGYAPSAWEMLTHQYPHVKMGYFPHPE